MGPFEDPKDFVEERPPDELLQAVARGESISEEDLRRLAETPGASMVIEQGDE